MTTRRQLVISDLSVDTGDGEAARLCDPLWVLARQWQLGELQGEDNGSPVRAHMEVEASLLGSWQPGPRGNDTAVRPWTGRSCPVEARVEGECWHTTTFPHFRLAAELGQTLQELLEVGGLSSTVELLKAAMDLQRPEKAAASDEISDRYVRMMAGRTLDGLAVWSKMAPLQQQVPSRLADVFSDLLATCTDDRGAVFSTLSAWLDICSGIIPEQMASSSPLEPAASWDRERQEYSFSVGARLDDGELALTAREYLGGEADWYCFVHHPARNLGLSAQSARKHYAFIPTPVSFPGMPNPRFWDFEDGRVNLPKLKRQESRQDPASQLFLDFALRSSNDWFSVPLPLPAGSVSRIRQFIVDNTFGERFLVPHAARVQSIACNFFAISAIASGTPGASLSQSQQFDDVFLLPMAIGRSLDSAPVEQIQLVRDELANLAWAIETIVESPAGTRVNRIEQANRERPAAEPVSTDSLPRYRLGTEIPPFWIPLVPEPFDSNESQRLRRSAVPRFTDNGAVPLPPQGRILEPGNTLMLFEEEVPREGSRIVRRYRYVRTADGKSVLWMARQKGAGQGEASSGLRFDVVEPITTQ